MFFVFIASIIVLLLILYKGGKNMNGQNPPQAIPQPTPEPSQPTPQPASQPAPQPTPQTLPGQLLAERVIRVWFNNNPYNRTRIEEISNAIVTWCERLNLNQEWVAAMAMQESSYGRFTSNTTSSARGVMQITRGTWDTINNLIRLYHPNYSTYATHTHEAYAEDIDSNIMHACVYINHILNRIIQTFNPPGGRNEPNIYILATYAYHNGPGYISRIASEMTYNEAVQRIGYATPIQTSNSITLDGVYHVRRVMNYYSALVR